MSWSTSAVVTDGDTVKLEAQIATNNENYYQKPVPESMAEQQEFALGVVVDAFEEGVVEGTYNVSLSGHSDPTQNGDRKSLGIHFSPTRLAEEVV